MQFGLGGRFKQLVENVAGLMHPAALVVVVGHLTMRFDLFGGFDLNRLGQHLPGSLMQNLRQQIPVED